MRIETEAACRIAAATAGMTLGSAGYAFVQADADYPLGCQYSGGDDAYFNTVAGAGSSGYQLLCATVTTGATLHTYARRRACTHRLEQQYCVCA